MPIFYPQNRRTVRLAARKPARSAHSAAGIVWRVCRPADEGVRSVPGHEIGSHSQRGAAAEGTDQHQRRRLRGDPQQGKHGTQHPGQQRLYTAGAKQGNRSHEHHQGRQDPRRGFQTGPGAVDHSGKQIHALPQPVKEDPCNKQGNEQRGHSVRSGGPGAWPRPHPRKPRRQR